MYLLIITSRLLDPILLIIYLQTTVSTIFQDYLNLSEFSAFPVFPTTTFEIEEEISNLNNSKSARPFSIPTKLLKMLKSILSATLAHIFNCSFSSVVVPDKLKKTNHISWTVWIPVKSLYLPRITAYD